MIRSVAAHVRGLDPRLKLGTGLALGPAAWLLDPAWVAVGAACLFVVVGALASARPLGWTMVRRLLFFVLLWTAVKIGLDLVSGLALRAAGLAGLILAVRLSGLLLLGLALALSTSTRALGMAAAWALRPVVGRERAWRTALSLALMVHFLPLCLATMEQVSSAFRQRCPRGGLSRRLTVVPLAVIRNLGQKTWSQTLAVAGRGLDDASAWEPDFAWNNADTLWLAVLGALLFAAFSA